MINDAALAEKPTLHGPTITLVPLAAHHTEPMWRFTADEETNRLTGTRQAFTQDQIRTWCATRAEQPDRLDLAVEDPATGRFLGELALNDLDRDNASASFRIALTPGSTGRGIGTEATRLLLRHAFEEVRLHRVHLEVWAFNERAARAYEKAGFILEGRARQAHHWAGEFHDVLHMAALRDEWLAARAQAY
ncbi:GNAT family protein [Streptomyces sp. CB01881]|uniref:GNAT family N-acetyltransferase n=1 Tax=Streptomyces sp. CB01881 TaxID=2078691 RepID=UPI000CDBF17C|nr:GNAT family protein [Streptomyces sp. CB01881]AUY51582.1 GNAT family N-acetyltransferase [Streptomyces sp. CB01881]TYC74972.1 N-acetyltransferase [Streptomyces sp. CB01881]